MNNVKFLKQFLPWLGFSFPGPNLKGQDFPEPDLEGMDSPKPGLKGLDIPESDSDGMDSPGPGFDSHGRTFSITDLTLSFTARRLAPEIKKNCLNQQILPMFKYKYLMCKPFKCEKVVKAYK